MFNKITNGASNDLERAKAHLKRYYSTYHFEKYTVKDLEQIILDRLNELYIEVVADFNADEHKEVLTALTDSIVTNRVLYSSDIAGICSKLLLKGGVI
jgi:hypothetical protein